MTSMALTLEEAETTLSGPEKPILRKESGRSVRFRVWWSFFLSEIEQLTSSVQEAVEKSVTAMIEGTEELMFEFQIARIENLARKVFTSPVVKVSPVMDDLYGLFVEVAVKGDAKKTLEEWLKLLDELKKESIDLPVYPKVLGKVDCTPGECGKLLGIGLSKLKTPLRLEETTDVAEIVREEREE